MYRGHHTDPFCVGATLSPARVCPPLHRASLALLLTREHLIRGNEIEDGSSPTSPVCVGGHCAQLTQLPPALHRPHERTLPIAHHRTMLERGSQWQPADYEYLSDQRADLTRTHPQTGHVVRPEELTMLYGKEVVRLRRRRWTGATRWLACNDRSGDVLWCDWPG